jgi:DNA-binding MarR family transcriptional regulator
MKRRQKDLFKLPNSIFTANLSTTQFKVIAALYSLRSRSIINGYKYVKISQKALKKICGVKSTQTISDAANALCRLGYIKRIDRYYDDYKKLGAFVYTLPVVTGRDFFFVSRRFFKYLLTAAQTRMYLFFCKCADSSSRWFWNSYNDICASLNLKRSAVIQTVKELCSIGLIKKRSVRKKDGSQSDNHYKVVTIKPPRIKKRNGKGRSYFALSFPQLSIFIKTLSNNIIKHEIIKVNTNRNKNFYCRGSPKKLSSLYSTHLYSNRKKKRNILYLKYRCNLGRRVLWRITHDHASARRISIHMGEVRSNQRTQLVRPPPRR